MGVAHSLKKMEAQASILGCTELPLILKGVKSPLNFIDANEVLAQAVVGRAKKS